MFGKYSPYNTFRFCADNKSAIKAYLKGQTIEAFEYKDASGDTVKVTGAVLGFMVLMFALAIALYVWAVVWLFKYRHNMDAVVWVIALLCLFFIGPIVTLLIIGFTKTDEPHPTSIETPGAFGRSGGEPAYAAQYPAQPRMTSPRMASPRMASPRMASQQPEGSFKFRFY